MSFSRYLGVVTKEDTFEKSSFSPKEQAELIHQADARIQETVDKIENLKKSGGSIESTYSLRSELIRLRRKREQLIYDFNPKMATIFSERHLTPSKLALLDSSKEIINFSNLRRIDDKTFGKLWQNPDYFIINRTHLGDYLDSTYVLNKDNFERLNKKGLRTFSDLQDYLGISLMDTKRYIKDGVFKPLYLKRYYDNEEIPVELIDIDNEDNAEAMERYRKLSNPVKKSPYLNKDWVTGKYLESLGFGEEKEIIELIKTGKIRGTVVDIKTSSGIKKEARVFFNDFETSKVLKSLRTNKTVKNIDEFASYFNVSKTDIENLILEGELQIVQEYIYPQDEKEILINLKNPKNANFINKKQYESALIKGDVDKKSSIITRLAFELTPRTKSIANELLSKNPVSDEIDSIRAFSNSLWEIAGEEEYKIAIKRIKKSLKEFKQLGYSKIEDEEIKELIKKILIEKQTSNNEN